MGEGFRVVLGHLLLATPIWIRSLSRRRGDPFKQLQFEQSSLAQLSPLGVSSVVPNNVAHALLMERNRANTQCHHHARMRDTVFAVRRHRVSPSQIVGGGARLLRHGFCTWKRAFHVSAQITSKACPGI